jgi:hypothetical protein
MCSNCTGDYENPDATTVWLDEMIERRENTLERMLREKLQAPPDIDLLDAALQEQWVRYKFYMNPLIIG